ncbi:phosphatidylethanolamine-binding protein 4 isoform X1 [Bufo gargarizans]|uniref:phosphatidylethanolamine-binding protein 4 isoform X1 n=1 Tax=Bufo gargarizans TaxID=30331 RepID=UPI001CF323D8|nr:phosphatidylethanolamine-binding protein 4 isoform X1 [Bufo gargarizans]
MWKALLLHMFHLSLVSLFSLIHATCDLQPITGDDATFCGDDLHVVYSDIGDVSCTHIPLCQNFTRDLIKKWGSPVVTYSNAQKDKLYLLMMVDPDAPSRENPSFKYWRHWLLADIQRSNRTSSSGYCHVELLENRLPGQDLLSGKSLKGRVITDYKGPSPPASTGYHRYEFHLYLQLPGSFPSLSPSEEESRGKFDPEAFSTRFSLGIPVASTLFMVQNPQQKDL